MPLTMAGMLAYLLQPLIRFLNYRLNVHRTYVVIAVYITILLLFLGGTVAIGLVAVDQATRLAVSLPDLIPRIVQQAQDITNQWADVTLTLGPYQLSFQALSDLIDWNAIANEARTLLQQILGQSTLALADAAQATLSTLGTAFTVFFISIYISMEGPRIGQFISDMANQPGYRKDADRLILDTLRIWNSYLRGQVILALVIFGVVSVALSLLRVNNALGLGIVSGVLEFLPIIGAVIGAGVAVVVALFQTPPWGLAPVPYALIVLGVMILIQQVQGNILVPRLVGDSVNLHPLLVIIAVLMGASLAGLLGAVLAAPVMGTLKLLAVYVWRKMLDLPPFPEDLTIDPPGSQPTIPAPDLHGYPFTFAPIFKDYIWGGRNLERILGRALPPGTVAESWEIAAHANGNSAINNGPLTGMTLAQAVETYGVDLLGTRNRQAAADQRFPLLIKLLDAQRWLSVQVHPDDEYAAAHAGDLGKTEMWIVLHAEPDAQLIYGFSRAISRIEVQNALEAAAQNALNGNDAGSNEDGGNGDADIEQTLQRVTVQTGDVIFVPAGAVHALGPGIIVAEIQQNSDTTYRLYDWGRPRETHIAQALEVLDFDLVRPGLVHPLSVENCDLYLDPAVRIACIGDSPYFRVERLHMPPGSKVSGSTDGATFEILGVLQGAACLHTQGDPAVIHSTKHSTVMHNAEPDSAMTATAAPVRDAPLDAIHGPRAEADGLDLTGVAWTLLPATMGDYTLEASVTNTVDASHTVDAASATDTVVVRIYTPPLAQG